MGQQMETHTKCQGTMRGLRRNSNTHRRAGQLAKGLVQQLQTAAKCAGRTSELVEGRVARLAVRERWRVGQQLERDDAERPHVDGGVGRHDVLAALKVRNRFWRGIADAEHELTRRACRHVACLGLLTW